jgi:hypothetical protein
MKILSLGTGGSQEHLLKRFLWLLKQRERCFMLLRKKDETKTKQEVRTHPWEAVPGSWASRRWARVSKGF